MAILLPGARVSVRSRDVQNVKLTEVSLHVCRWHADNTSMAIMQPSIGGTRLYLHRGVPVHLVLQVIASPAPAAVGTNQPPKYRQHAYGFKDACHGCVTITMMGFEFGLPFLITESGHLPSRRKR
jgi:hypothetical protein